MKLTNQAGINLIKDAEGCRLTAYVCPAGVKTIGFGHTGPDVKLGMTITPERAAELFTNDLRQFEVGVAQLCPVTTDNQFSSLVSFAFNLGLDSLRTSTLQRMHNEGDYAGAQGQFGKWCHGGGKTLPGLVKRRLAESKLYGSVS